MGSASKAGGAGATEAEGSVAAPVRVAMAAASGRVASAAVATEEAAEYDMGSAAASSSAAQSRWPEYGAVPMRRCPDCPRPQALKRMVSKTDENGNLGRHFVSCLSIPMIGQDGKMLKKCSHFEWIDQYVDRIESERHIDMSDAATRDQILPLFAVERPNFSSCGGVRAERPMPTARITRIAERVALAELPVEAEVNEELNKVKKLLRQMEYLQKQANLMALFFLYLLFVRR
ncbi:hypothetical protein D1007_47500 [Hordeum vulgare]|nr:hypothetical protein D1007_47500 [Hordeum vulgare]